MICLKHLSVKHRQFGDTEFTLLSGAMKTGRNFSPDKTHIAILSCRLLWIWCGKALLFTWLQDKHNHSPLRSSGHRKKILSSLTAGTGIICHTGFLYLETCVSGHCRQKRYFIQAKIPLPQAYDYSLAWSVSLTGPEQYSNLHIKVSAFRHSSPVLRVFC